MQYIVLLYKWRIRGSAELVRAFQNELISDRYKAIFIVLCTGKNYRKQETLPIILL